MAAQKEKERLMVPYLPGIAFNPERDEKSKPFLSVPGAVYVRHRFDASRFLCDRLRILGKPPGGLFVLAMDKAAARYILPDRPTALVGVEGHTVFIFDVLESGNVGYKIGQQGNVESHPTPKYKLFAYDIDSPDPPKLLCPEPIERVFALREDGLWLSFSEQPQQLWRLTKDGRNRKKIFEAKVDWLLPQITWAFSPNGKRLALGVAKKGNVFDKRDLVVIDTENGATIREQPDIPVQVSGDSSFMPELVMNWLDERRLRFSETEDKYFRWVELDVESGKRLSETRYGEIGHRHGWPFDPSEKVAEHGRFVWRVKPTELKVLLKGEKVPLIEGNANTALSPDHRWLAWIMIRDVGRWEHSVNLCDGQTGSRKVIAKVWISDLQWFPAARR